MNKILDKIIRSEYAPSNKNVVWDDGKEFKTYEKGKWKSKGGGGNGVSIVDSVDKLDANAPAGTLAAVAVPGSIKESSIRDLYQPDASIIDQAAGTLTHPELLSQVSSISITAPEGNINGINGVTGFYLVPRTFSMENSQMLILMIASNDGIVTGVGGVDMISSTMYPFITYTNGIPTIDYSAIENFNTILASDEWCYLSMPESGFFISEEEFDLMDQFITAIAGVPSTADIYVKKDKWEELHSKDLESIIKDVDTLKTSKVNNIPISTYSSYQGISPNIYYTYNCDSTGTISLKFNAIEDTTIYNEYIIEIKCTSTPTSISFVNSSDSSEMSIIWPNGIAPVFTEGATYIISIANGYGVYSMFPNS